ncbi:hypothetical protein AYO44_11485 [Planctomycetaceae bacterium SCGC AG-212-F19]|nr:hypothetical protein AYO44_11485 [Planctomycetaceae bacterium SCGC AG-212-F19]
MEKRRLKTKLAGVYHLGELSVGLTPEEQKSLDSLIADGMDKQQARGFVLGMRKDQGNMTIAAGTVITVIGKTSWPADREDPNPVLVVQSSTGVVGLVRASNTDPVVG